MLEWLRDAFANTSPSLSYRHSMIPSSFFRQQQQNPKENPIFSPSEDDDETDDESNENSFYHNPYHSSGQMNYTDVPQQQYTNQHNYPTYLARQQTSNNTTNQTIDEQIHAKLLSLKQRGNHFPSYSHRQYDYAYRNRLLPTSHPSLNSNVNSATNEEQLEEQQEEQKEDEDSGISTYYHGQYPNLDENFDFASVVLWYRNVMQSVKKFM